MVLIRPLSLSKQLIGLAISLLLSGFILNNVALANTRVQVNSVTVNVTDRSPAARQAAITNAFDQVLIKMSGNTQLINNSAVKDAKAQASLYVQSYRYINPGSTNPTLRMHITFNQAALTKLLGQLNQNLWSANRPQTLIWISTKQQTPLTSNSPEAIEQIIKQQTDLRGLPIVLAQQNAPSETPLLTNSNNALPLGENDALFTGPALQALQKQYQTDAVLAVSINGQTDAWTATWWLWRNGQVQHWQDNNSNLNALIQGGVNHLATSLAHPASLNAQIDSFTAAHVWLAIMGVDDLATFNHVLNTIKQLPMVKNAQVSDTGGDGLLLQVTLAGKEEELIDALNNNPQLIVLPQQSSNHTLYYRWLGPERNTEEDNSDLTQPSSQANTWQLHSDNTSF